MHPLSVLLVDDNEEFRQNVYDYLANDPGVVVKGQTDKGLEAIRLVHSLHPDVILLDISMPAMSGFEAANQIKKVSPNTKIIFLTIHEELSYRSLATMLGADGFIAKSSLKKDLPTALERVRRELGEGKS